MQTLTLVASLFTATLIAPEGTFPANHGSTVAGLGDGGRLACWFAGSGEAQRDVEIVCSRLDAGAHAWSAPAPAVKAGERADGAPLANKFVGNPVLHRASGRVVLAYNDPTTGRNPLSLAVSEDGVTFTKVRDLENEPGDSFAYPALVRGDGGLYDLTYTWRGKAAIKHVSFDDAWLSSK